MNWDSSVVLRVEDARGYWRIVHGGNVIRHDDGSITLRGQAWQSLHFWFVRVTEGRPVYRANVSAIGPEHCTCPLHHPQGWNKPERHHANDTARR